MNYTIRARTAEQWAHGIKAMINNAGSVEEINQIRHIHMTTAQAVKKTHPEIMRMVAETVKLRMSMLAQKP